MVACLFMTDAMLSVYKSLYSSLLHIMRWIIISNHFNHHHWKQSHLMTALNNFRCFLFPIKYVSLGDLCFSLPTENVCTEGSVCGNTGVKHIYQSKSGRNKRILPVLAADVLNHSGCNGMLKCVLNMVDCITWFWRKALSEIYTHLIATSVPNSMKCHADERKLCCTASPVHLKPAYMQPTSCM